MNAILLVGLVAGAAHAQSFGGFDEAVDAALNNVVGGIAAGDLNGDGAADLIVMPLIGSTAQVALSNGDASFTLSDLPLAGMGGAIAIGHFNGDAFLDCAVAYQVIDSVEVFFGDGAGGFPSSTLSPVSTTAPVSMAAGDLTNDGVVDLILCASDATIPLFNDGAGSFAEGTAIDAEGDFLFPEVADVNGDDYADLILPDINGARLYVALNIDGVFAVPDEYQLIAPSVAVGDLDDDGDADLVVPGSGQVNILYNNGDGTFERPVSLPLPGAGRGVDVADLEGDGDLDFVVSTNNDGAFAYLSDGVGGFQASDPIGVGFDDPLHLLLADITGDRLDDLVLGPAFNTLLSAYANLSVGLPPAPFALQAPANGATGLALPENANAWGGGATLTWDRAAGLNVTYDVVIAADPELQVVIHQATEVQNPALTIPEKTLAPGTAYYWGVVAHNPLGSIVSTPASSGFATQCVPDVNQDGMLNILDFVAFQQAFLLGCDL